MTAHKNILTFSKTLNVLPLVLFSAYWIKNNHILFCIFHRR